jgi:vesicle-associated membrane protein 7
MNPSNIKYLLIGNTDTVKIITEYVVVRTSQTQMEAKQIFEKLSKSQEKKIDERNKIQSNQGNYYFTISRPNVFFLLLVEMNYSERKVFELIENICDDKIPTMVNDKGELNGSGRQLLKQIVDRYQDGSSRLSDVSNDVNEIQLEMKDNIKKVLTNVEDVKKLQESSDRIKLSSDEYKKNAKSLERATWWQNCKLNIIIGSVVLGLLLIIIIPLCTGKSSSKS